MDINTAITTYHAMALRTPDLVHSCHTPTLGGLAVAFALAAAGGRLGAEIDLAFVPREKGISDDAALFSESNSRFVITCPPDRVGEIQSMFAGVPCAQVGKVTADGALKITGASNSLVVDLHVDAIAKAFKEPLFGI